MNSHSNSPRTVLTDFTCTAFTLPVSWSALVVCSLSRWIEAKALSSGLARWHCFSVMQQCDTKSVFSASCPFFLTLHWSIHSDMSEAWCSAALFGFLSNTIRLEWRWRLRCLHIQSKICLILLHRPLQMRAFCFSEGCWFDAFINWQSRVIHAYLKSPTILGVTFNGSGDWQKVCVCVCVLSHLVIWQCWQTATQATDSYSSSLISSALSRPLHWPANRLLLHCWAQHTVAHMPLKTTSRVFWTKRNLLILMSQQDTAKWTTAVGW